MDPYKSCVCLFNRLYYYSKHWPHPTVKMDRIVLEGSIPSPANPPSGCKFHTRCPNCMEICKSELPPQREIEPGHYVVCHLYNNQ